jgi:hypothetical protein
MRTVICGICLLIDELEMVDRVFISKIESREEIKMAERQRERECVRGRAQLKTKGSIGNKINHWRETFVATM